MQEVVWRQGPHFHSVFRILNSKSIINRNPLLLGIFVAKQTQLATNRVSLFMFYTCQVQVARPMGAIHFAIKLQGSQWGPALEKSLEIIIFFGVKMIKKHQNFFISYALNGFKHV